MKHRLPIIAIVGRPNVGKSSLFNRLIKRRHAITSPLAGTTRDRIYHHAEFGDLTGIVVDTGGLAYGKKENIEADMAAQAHLAIDEADLIYFVVDVKEGLTIEDHEAAKILRKSQKKIVIIANKIDAKGTELQVIEAAKLGFGEPIEISAYHGQGVDELIETTTQTLKKSGFYPRPKDEQKPSSLRISFLGRPNVGKSSLVNALLGKPQVIVSEVPGTTRDAIDVEITWKDYGFTLIDTAGLRRRGRIERGLEKLSSFRSLDAIERSDVACLILDFEQGISKQDQHLASYILEAGKGLILVVNKTDLMEDREKDESEMINILRHRYDFLPWAPVIFVSALKRKNVEKILEVAREIENERFRRIDHDELLAFMKETVTKNLPPIMGRFPMKFYDLEQTDINPPTFSYSVNDPSGLHFSYRRYLENRLRERWPFTGTAVKFIFQRRQGKKRR